MQTKERPIVCVAHGFLGSPVEFLLFKHHLGKLGFNVRIFGHPTVTKSVSRYADEFVGFVLRGLPLGPKPKVHLVGHSMGAIIVRGAIPKLQDALSQNGLGRAVLLAPPNKGSHAADWCPQWLRDRVEAINDLDESPESYVNGLQKPCLCGVETGVIWSALDHMIKPDSAQAGCEPQNCLRLDDLHTTMVLRARTATMVARFLKNGNFSEPD